MPIYSNGKPKTTMEEIATRMPRGEMLDIVHIQKEILLAPLILVTEVDHKLDRFGAKLSEGPVAPV